MSLNRARILSSENDASVKQDQNTNINIKISRETGPIGRPGTSSLGAEPVRAFHADQRERTDQREAQAIVSPKRQYIPGSEGGSIQTQRENNANFTIPQDSPQCGMTDSVYQYQPTIDRDAQLESALTEPALRENNELEIKNKFLEILISIYEANPLRVSNYLVCHSNTLMELIKVLTEADKVELVIDEEQGCTGCISNSKYMNIQRILVTKNDKTNDLKYAYNDVYAQLIRHNISLKVCI